MAVNIRQPISMKFADVQHLKFGADQVRKKEGAKGSYDLVHIA